PLWGWFRTEWALWRAVFSAPAGGETREEFFRRMIREIIERRIADPHFIEHVIQRHRFAGRPLPPNLHTMLLELDAYVATMERGETPQGPSWLVQSHPEGGDRHER